MSQENVELVRAGYDAFNRGDIEWVVEHVSPGFEFNTRAEGPDLPRVIRGKDGLRQLFSEWFVGPWEGGLRQDVEHIYDVGDDRVLGLVIFRGRGQESGIDVELPYAHIFTLREGLVTHIEGFLSWERAKEAAGLPK
jgi:ketosteroid isomerase-like protein